MQEELVIRGSQAEAKIFTHNINEETIGQIYRLVNHPFAAGSTVRIMPDTHIGKGAVVGTTITFSDKVVPDVVGVDVGCGMFVAELGSEFEKGNVDMAKLDAAIRLVVPAGTSIRNHRHPLLKGIDLDGVYAPITKRQRTDLSLGSLGGGNHFVELNEGKDGKLYLVIHSGSRSLGQDVAKFHQRQAVSFWAQQNNRTQKGEWVDPEFAYLVGDGMQRYLSDLRIAQQYAHLNRKAMISEIVNAMGWAVARTFDTVHNYADLDAKILRKGAISAKAGEEVLIPINMRDGSILAVGKGNADWNNSAPHGAGRLLSRSQARKQLDMDAFIETMKDVYTTSVRPGTIDEAPFAYKSMDEILERTKETFDVKDILRPLYNFKA